MQANHYYADGYYHQHYANNSQQPANYQQPPPATYHYQQHSQQQFNDYVTINPQQPGNYSQHGGYPKTHSQQNYSQQHAGYPKTHPQYNYSHQNNDTKINPQQNGDFPKVPQSVHPVNGNDPTLFAKNKCIVITVFKLFTLLTTLSVLQLYYNATFVTHDLPRKLFIIIVGCEVLPRIIQTYQVYKFTDKKLTINDAIGTLLCQINYYYWMGKERATLKRAQVNQIELLSDLISVIKLFVLAYILYLQTQKLDQQGSDMGKKVVNDMSSAIEREFGDLYLKNNTCKN
ncbi:21153_t:CDS:2 [Cetraspora pellucida]|uniref:21153_t:CDS:1 n=1 Tax=Cetraspora pellucida TaxID=1433469 RepID=A0A9N9G858_9GLOM|nr:21153_t:CDS:2 [Cetraspora pellucida]